MSIINKGMIALRRTRERIIGILSTLARLAMSIRKSLQIHGESILIASSYIVVVTLAALMLFDSNFRTDALNRLENSRQIVDNAIQGRLNAIINGFTASVRHLDGY